MSKTIIITGSPSSSSKTAKLAQLVGQKLASTGVQNTLLDVRSLPAEDLLLARASAPGIQSALAEVEAAQGVVIATPIYKAAYSGLLKTFLDLLPQFGLRSKVVLPLATGGSLAHVLAIDYALRPVLSSLDPLHVVPGLFVLDKHLSVKEDGSLELDADLAGTLDRTISSFKIAVRRAAHEVV